MSMTQETLQNGHGDKVSTYAEDSELRAVAQGRQNSLEVGIHDPTHI